MIYRFLFDELIKSRSYNLFLIIFEIVFKAETQTDNTVIYNSVVKFDNSENLAFTKLSFHPSLYHY